MQAQASKKCLHQVLCRVIVAACRRTISPSRRSVVPSLFSGFIIEQNRQRPMRFCLHFSVIYHNRRTDFTLSAADDLMDFLAGGSHQNVSTCLVMPAPLANEREEGL